MAVPPREPGYRRYWTRYNRPYGGCGCFYALLLVMLFWWLLSFLFTPLAFWY